MEYALLSVGLLGLLVFLLGANVSRMRQSVTVTQHEAEADPKSALAQSDPRPWQLHRICADAFT